MANILIVDDDKIFGHALRALLRKSGHEATCVEHGNAALASVLDTTPDMVVLDLFMPEMDGIGFLEVVRSYLRLAALPVLVVTGLQDSSVLERARMLKVNAILLKHEASPPDIVRVVQQQLLQAEV